MKGSHERLLTAPARRSVNRLGDMGLFTFMILTGAIWLKTGAFGQMAGLYILLFCWPRKVRRHDQSTVIEGFSSVASGAGTSYAAPPERDPTTRGPPAAAQRGKGIALPIALFAGLALIAFAVWRSSQPQWDVIRTQGQYIVRMNPMTGATEACDTQRQVTPWPLTQSHEGCFPVRR